MADLGHIVADAKTTLAISEAWLARHHRAVSTTFLSLLFALLSIFLLSATIHYSDTDLWYHLAGGRHFFDTGTPSNPFERSYLTEVNPFYNYYWGFQALLYGSWLLAGYAGIIVLKASLVLATAYFVARHLLSGRGTVDASFFQLLLLALIVYIVSVRGIAVRPHFFSYFFIAAFTYILLHKKRLIPILPVLTVIWVNTHGVEWVVGALICGSYVFQQLLRYQQQRDFAELKPCLWVMACLPLLLLNPYGYKVLLAPFLTPPETYQFIHELAPYKLIPTLDFSQGLNKHNVSLVLIAITVLGASKILRDRAREQIMPLLLAIGGALLLSRGARFLWEWVLLTTPLLAVIAQTDHRYVDLKRALGLTIVITLVVFSWGTINRPYVKAWPFDEATLPKGTTDFIELAGASNRYLVPVTAAGYVEWRLPDTKVHMDLQMPPYDSFDYFEAFAAQYTEAGLAHVVSKYRPDYIAVLRDQTDFPRIVHAQGYAPVFYDQLLVLYVNRSLHPGLAKQYELRFVDPFNPDRSRADRIDATIAELERMLTVSPGMPSATLTLSGYLVAQSRYQEAQDHLLPLAQRYPDDASVLYLLAQIAAAQDRLPAAISYLEHLMPVTGEPARIGSQLAEYYFLTGDHRRAYRAFSASINPYLDIEHNLRHYYFYAFSAYVIGEHEQAAKLLRIIEVLHQGDDELSRQVSQLKEILAVPDETYGVY